ncbi:hypothetical protein [Streptomyces sp. NPDC001530]|uniref:hypothetical protein n=1 Tax=Streptomyces sp. NPDC001530 TaxID=3364582 RepID=UPI0036BECEE4
MREALVAYLSATTPREEQAADSAFHRAGEGHTALYEAIAAGEPERAEESAGEHFMISAEMIRDVLARARAAEPT